jgi:hypothetical protein
MEKNYSSLKNKESILDTPGYGLVRIHLYLTKSQHSWVKKSSDGVGMGIATFLRAFIDRYQLAYEEEQEEKKKYGIPDLKKIGEQATTMNRCLRPNEYPLEHSKISNE